MTLCTVCALCTDLGTYFTPKASKLPNFSKCPQKYFGMGKIGLRGMGGLFEPPKGGGGGGGLAEGLS